MKKLKNLFELKNQVWPGDWSLEKQNFWDVRLPGKGLVVSFNPFFMIISIKKTGFESKNEVSFFKDFWKSSFEISYFKEHFLNALAIECTI